MHFVSYGLGRPALSFFVVGCFLLLYVWPRYEILCTSYVSQPIVLFRENLKKKFLLQFILLAHWAPASKKRKVWWSLNSFLSAETRAFLLRFFSRSFSWLGLAGYCLFSCNVSTPIHGAAVTRSRVSRRKLAAVGSCVYCICSAYSVYEKALPPPPHTHTWG